MVGTDMAKQTENRTFTKTDYSIPADVFIEVWEKASTIQEAHGALKKYSEQNGTPVMPPAIIAARAAEYRKTLPLKRMPRISARTLDTKALTAVLAKVRGEKVDVAEKDVPVLTRSQVEEVVMDVLRKIGLVK